MYIYIHYIYIYIYTYVSTLAWKQAQMRVHLPVTVQALPGAIGPLPKVPCIPSIKTYKQQTSIIYLFKLNMNSI